MLGKESVNKEKRKVQFEINTLKCPNVLLLGNGMLKLLTDKWKKGISWEELLNNLKPHGKTVNVNNVPLAMQPEVYCGVDVYCISYSWK
ncbi:hypothetical protein [Oribacterium sp. NK2B42]|uniref:hypothetical protein n=1 Tax=Oribacterium sp. NK2B42 TaxID=689781 RepID=UPI001A9A07B9|nr:hypothetical protein [Oribacterium sp. NK2B42]